MNSPAWVTSCSRALVERIRASSAGQRIARGAGWTLLGSIAAKVLNLPVSVILARLMGSEHYGELGIVNNSIDLFCVFAGFGLGLTATKHVAELRGHNPARAGRILALSNLTALLTGACFSLALFLLAPSVASTFLAAPQLANLLRIGALILFFAALNGAQTGALFGFEAFRTLAELQTIIALLSMIFMLAGYYLGGLKGVLYGILLSRITDWGFRHFALRKEARRGGIAVIYCECFEELSLLWRFSLPAVISGALVSPINWICAAMLVNQPHGYQEMGVYSAANQWYGALVFLPVVLGSGLLPLFSERLGAGDVESSRKVLSFMLRLNTMIVLPCALAILLLSPHIMRTYGRGFSQAWPTLIVVVTTAAIYGLIAPVGDVIAASGRMWLGLLMNAGWGLIFISTTVLFVGKGSFGLASARLLAYAVHAIWTLAFAYKLIGYKSRGCNVEGAVVRLQFE